MGVKKYKINLEYDSNHGEIGELIDTFRRPDGRMMYTILFPDGSLKGYFYDELEEPFKIVKS